VGSPSGFVVVADVCVVPLVVAEVVVGDVVVREGGGGAGVEVAFGGRPVPTVAPESELPVE
jgi:hypothetical protein